MRPKGDLQVARLLCAEVAGDYRFELWKMPHNKASEKYVVLVLLRGVEVNSHPYASEVRAREEMERMVENKS